MKPIEGRLQTGEHILARVIQNKFRDAKVVIAKFEEDRGSLDILCEEDLRDLDLAELESGVNEIIEKNLEVRKTIFERSKALREFDLSKIPKDLKEIRIVEIGNFDRRPCRDPHVNNTFEIGKMRLRSVKREGKDRYRFIFYLDSPSII